MEEVNVEQQLQEQAQQARELYEKRYGEPVPDEYANDKAFLSALLSDPKWDAKAYMKEKEDDLPNSADALWPIYRETFGKNVANIKKNDVAWMKAQIRAARDKE